MRRGAAALLATDAVAVAFFAVALFAVAFVVTALGVAAAVAAEGVVVVRGGAAPAARQGRAAPQPARAF